MIEVSFIIPCLNEETTLGAVIDEIHSSFDGHLEFEILVCDNGSSDNSRKIAYALGAKVINVPEKGYGNAIRGGISNANGSIGVMGDADGSYTFGEAQGLIQAIRDGAVLAIGNRFKGGIQSGAMPFLHQYLGNPVLSFLGRLLHRSGVSDFHCGLRAFRLNEMKALQFRSSGMEFASEMIVRTAKSGQRIDERPVTLKPDGRNRAPHLRTWSDGWRHLSFLLTTTGPSGLLISGALLLSGATLVLVAVVAVLVLSEGTAELDGPRMQSIYMSVGIIACTSVLMFQIARDLAELMDDEKTGIMKSQSRDTRLKSSFFVSLSLLSLGALVILIEAFRWSRRDYAAFPGFTWITSAAIVPFVVGANGVFLSTLALVMRRKEQW
jgi:hypothetical protein